MHENNRRWLADLQKRFQAAFFGPTSVLELGSRIWGTPSDTIRFFFPDCRHYVGVDREPGPGVDLVCDALATTFRPGEFDVLAIFSVFEHEPRWRELLAHNLQWLRPGGLVITCFGAEGNLHHAPEPWAPVPHQEFLDHAVALGLVPLEAFFEESVYGPNCAGCYNAVLGKPGKQE